MYTTILIVLILMFLLRKYLNSPRTKLIKDMSGKIIVITGSSAGIGKEAAKFLYQQGARIIMANRSKEKTEGVIEYIKKSSKVHTGEMVFLPLDLSDFKSVVKFTQLLREKYRYIDYLINNAGMVIEKYTRTVDGLESTFQTNHLSPVLLTSLVLDLLENSPNAGRVINVSSNAHQFPNNKDFFSFKEKDWAIFESYGWSKLGNIFFTFALCDYFEKKNLRIKSASLHPGAVYTEIARADNKPWYYRLLIAFGNPVMMYTFKSEEVGAQTTLHCCYLDDNDFVNKGYYENCRLSKLGKPAFNKEFEQIIREVTHQLITDSQILKNIDHPHAKEFLEFMGKF